MPIVPTNPHTVGTAHFVKDYRLVVLLGPAGGGAPDATDEVLYLHPVEIKHSAGGQEMDYCRFEYLLGQTGQQLVDIRTQLDWNREVEVWIADADGNLFWPLFWGELGRQSIAVEENAESVVVTATVAPYHFGDFLDGIDVLEPNSSVEERHPRTMSFNPLVDGIVENNMSDLKHSVGGHRLWIDPDSMRESPAKTEQGAVASAWNLANAINSLCEVQNAGPTRLVENPLVVDTTITSYDPIPPLDTAPDIKNVSLRRGPYLPQNLDRLLPPHGFDWYTMVSANTAGTASERTMIVFKHGEGVEKDLYFQRPGESLDVSDSNLPKFGIDWNIQDLANIVVGHGSVEERELTIELYRGWPVGNDTLYTVADLNKSDPLSDYNLTAGTTRETWRLWVANEAGDWNLTRPEIPNRSLDLSSEFTDYVPRRRVFGPSLHFDKAGHRLKPFVEYSTDGGTNWSPVENKWHCRVLTDQLGVEFDGRTPPEPLMASAKAGADVRVRITGTVRGDARLTGETNVTNDSPNSRAVKLFLNLPDRFHDRQIQTTGTYASKISGSVRANYGSDTASDQTALDDFLGKAQAVHESAVLGCQFLIDGIDLSYEIGDLITKIEGRNIVLDRNAPSTSNRKYLQVTGVKWLYPRQQTELIVQAVERR